MKSMDACSHVSEQTHNIIMVSNCTTRWLQSSKAAHWRSHGSNPLDGPHDEAVTSYNTQHTDVVVKLML